MRRLPLILAVLVAGALALTVLERSGDSSTFKVDAVFDTARGMVPGQLVKIAGTRVGTVTDLELQPQGDGGYRARMTLEIDDRFKPFRRDASCRILPEGLISENYVECSPGSRSAGPLPAGPAGRPTVAVERTSASVSLQDVLNTFSLPTDKRIRLFLDNLGIGTAGRGDDINAILRRANPSLVQARRALAVLATQNQRISTAVRQTDVVLADLAERASDVRQFVGHAASLSRTTAGHRRALSESVRRFPAMLTALRDGLGSIRSVTRDGTPLLADVRRSAPELVELTRRVEPFTKAARPALQAVGRAADRGSVAAPAIAPAIRHLRQLARQTPDTTKLLRDLLVSTRNRGGIDGLLRFLYALSTFSGPYDGLSHIVGLSLSAFPDCIASNSIGKPNPGCSHSYNAKNFGRVPLNAPTVDPGPDDSPAINTVSPGLARQARQGGRELSDSATRQLLEFILR